MSEFHPVQRLLPAEMVDYAAEAELVQQRASLGRPSAIRIGLIVLFSTASRDAWMIEVQTGSAARLACADEVRPAAEGVSPMIHDSDRLSLRNPGTPAGRAENHESLD